MKYMIKLKGKGRKGIKTRYEDLEKSVSERRQAEAKAKSSEAKAKGSEPVPKATTAEPPSVKAMPNPYHVYT